MLENCGQWLSNRWDVTRANLLHGELDLSAHDLCREYRRREPERGVTDRQTDGEIDRQTDRQTDGGDK